MGRSGCGSGWCAVAVSVGMATALTAVTASRSLQQAAATELSCAADAGKVGKSNTMAVGRQADQQSSQPLSVAWVVEGSDLAYLLDAIHGELV